MPARPNNPRFSVVAAVIASAMLWMGLFSRGAPTTAGTGAENPHWKKDGCGACHDMSSGSAAPIAQEKIDRLCLGCHDGKKAAAEVHPIGRKLRPADHLIKPDKWPTPNDEIGCITCHDAQFACDLKTNPRAANRNLLRIQRDGAARGQSFCQNCHQSEAYSKINPHLMLGDGKEIIESKCLFCHAKVQDRKATERAHKPDLKAEQGDICRDCHPRHKDPITQMHIGLRMTPEQQAFVYAKEVLGLSSNPSKEFVHKAEVAGRVPKLVVPAAKGVIVCSTCHNPHLRGVFSDESELGYRAMRLDRRNQLISPVREPIWCRHCHAM